MIKLHISPQRHPRTSGGAREGFYHLISSAARVSISDTTHVSTRGDKIHAVGPINRLHSIARVAFIII